MRDHKQAGIAGLALALAVAWLYHGADVWVYQDDFGTWQIVESVTV
jgi:hypothetical protein